MGAELKEAFDYMLLTLTWCSTALFMSMPILYGPKYGAIVVY